MSCGTVMQWVVLPLHSSRVHDLILTSGDCLFSVSRVLPVSLWGYIGFSGFSPPSKIMLEGEING